MQKVLVIYDNNNKIVTVMYGMDTVPDGVQGFICSLRDGETIIGDTVDRSNPEQPKAETSGGIDLEDINIKLASQQEQFDMLCKAVADLIGGVSHA